MGDVTATELSKQTLNFTFGNILNLYKKSAPVLLFMGSAIVIYISGAFVPEGSFWETISSPLAVILYIIAVVMMAFFAMVWFRFVVQGTDAHKASVLDFQTYDWKFMGMYFSPILLMAIIAMLFSAIPLSDNALGYILLLIFIGGMIAYFIAVLKLSYVAIGQAVGDKIGMKQSWAMTNGMIWPIIGCWMVCSIVMWVVAMIATSIVGGVLGAVSGGNAGIISMGVIVFSAALGMIQLCFYFTSIALAYKAAKAI